jgi:uncharacterized lipoprotein YehR (DUF1307 family)
MIWNLLSALFALIIVINFAGCGDGDSSHKFDIGEKF